MKKTEIVWFFNKGGVPTATREAFKWLLSEKEKKKKVKNNSYENFEICEYLTTDKLDIEQKRFLMHLRSHMLMLRDNFKHMQRSSYCPLCISSNPNSLNHPQDTQMHLLSCTALSEVTDILQNNLEYSDIFGSDVAKQIEMTILLENKYKQRKKKEIKLKI